MKKLLFTTFVLLSTNLFAGTSWISFGTMTHNFLTSQSDTKGGTTTFDLAPTLLIGTTLPFFFQDTNLTPSLGYAKYFTKDGSTKSDIIIQYHMSYSFFSGFEGRFGFSNYITSIGGDGKSIDLNNGNSTATFYAPSETKKTYTASMDFGAKFNLMSSWSCGLQFSVMRFLSSDRRRVSHLLTLDYLL